MLKWAVCWGALAAALAGTGEVRLVAQSADQPVLSAVLSRAATYVERFADRVAGFVTEETYQQDVFLPINRFGARPGQRDEGREREVVRDAEAIGVVVVAIGDAGVVRALHRRRL